MFSSFNPDWKGGCYQTQNGLNSNPMKVAKDQFDALLQRMIVTPPEKTASIKSEKTGQTIIPPKTQAGSDQR